MSIYLQKSKVLKKDSVYWNVQAEKRNEMFKKNKLQKYQLHRKPKILIIEDNDVLRKVFSEFLKSFNCDMVTTGEGYKGIELMDESIDLVLSDIELPDVRGIQVCQHLRQTTIGKNLPIIAVTACDDSIEKECLQAGFNAIYYKPLLLDGMKEILATWLPASFRKTNFKIISH